MTRLRLYGASLLLPFANAALKSSRLVKKIGRKDIREKRYQYPSAKQASINGARNSHARPALKPVTSEYRAQSAAITAKMMKRSCARSSATSELMLPRRCSAQLPSENTKARDRESRARCRLAQSGNRQKNQVRRVRYRQGR